MPRLLPVKVVAIVAFAALAAAQLGCSKAPTRPDSETIQATAEKLRASAGVLPRGEALAVVQGLIAEGSGDPGSWRGQGAHAAAARLLERLFREGGRLDDGVSAASEYRAAALRLEVVDDCEFALLSARLTGEVSGDVSSSYAALYRFEQELAPSAATKSICAAVFARELAKLAPFRPPVGVLEAIDHRLAATGMLQRPATKGALPVAETQGNRIEKLEKWVGPDGARLVLFLKQPAPFRVGDEVTPWGTTRTYVDIEGVPADGLEITTVGMVTKIRSESTEGGAKISVELDGKGFRKVFHLPEPYRIVIDIARQPPPSGRTVGRVILDPGHGGNDPGATSATGLREKDVTLALAHKIAPVLARDGVSVVLTRDVDQYVTLEERTARANASSADLFISLHCNASESKGRRGIETYVLDTSRSEMASRLAARENATSHEATAELSSILASMRIADQAERSTHLAALVQKAALAAVRPSYSAVTNGGVHTAGFYVLVGARMPGVLFEASYLSHPDEGELLGQDDYQSRLADGVVNAIRAYRAGR